jgi:predicted  nucleic acid-binding Zn-ribbon protein
MDSTKKQRIMDTVEGDVVEATALAIRSEVSDLSQDVIQDELRLGHLSNMGMMEIQDAVETKRMEYEKQLDEIQEAVNDATTRKTAAHNAFEKEVERFIKRFTNTELRRKIAQAHRRLAALSDLASDFDKIENQGALNVKSTRAYKKIEEVQDEIKRLMEINAGVRREVQKLDRERREMEIKLRRDVRGKSVVAQEIHKMLKDTMAPVKKLTLPAPKK